MIKNVKCVRRSTLCNLLVLLVFNFHIASGQDNQKKIFACNFRCYDDSTVSSIDKNDLKFHFESNLQGTDRSGDAMKKIETLIKQADASLDFGEANTALECLLNALALADQLQAHGFVSKINYKIGLLYSGLGDDQKAIEYFGTAIVKEQELTQRNLVMTALAQSYNRMQEYQTAFQFLEIVSNNCNQAFCDTTILLRLELGFALCKFKEGDCLKSTLHVERALTLARNVKDTYSEAASLVLFAKTKQLQNQDNSAIEMLKRAEQLCRNASFDGLLIEVYDCLVSIELKYRRYKQASLFQMKHKGIIDSINAATVQNRLQTVELEFKERESKAKIASQSQLIALKKSVTDFQNLLLLCSLIAALILLALVVAIWKLRKDKNDDNSILTKKVGERTHELQEKLRIFEQQKLLRNERVLLTTSLVKARVSSIEALCEVASREMLHSKIVDYRNEINFMKTQLQSDIDLLCADTDQRL